MFTASYPASFLPEEHGKGFHVRFTDLPEALTGGDDIEDTFVQAADCLAEAMRAASPAVTRFPRRQNRSEASTLSVFLSILRRSWRYTLPFANAAYPTLT